MLLAAFISFFKDSNTRLGSKTFSPVCQFANTVYI